MYCWDKWVLAVSGTHGKTTTSSMLAWILEYAGMAPGFLIGGVPANFGVSARAGESDFFVVEADEYDTAFFDKRSKFVHYRPRTLAINNLEFDHADIFDDLAAIQRQFHHLVRCVPGEGLIVHPPGCAARSTQRWQWDAGRPWPRLASVRHPGLTGGAELLTPDGSCFSAAARGAEAIACALGHCGLHNVENALAAMAAARHVGVAPEVAASAWQHFAG